MLIIQLYRERSVDKLAGVLGEVLKSGKAPALSRFSTSEFFRAKRLFTFVLELSAATMRN